MLLGNFFDLGVLIKIKNTKKQKNENDFYISLRIEDENGKNERCLLFTEDEIKKMEKIKLPFIQEDMSFGKIYKASIGNINTNLIKVKNGTETVVFRISESQLKKADFRSIKNVEDLTKKGFLVDF